jgi:pyridoxamine 5'-phosphate oxidase
MEKNEIVHKLEEIIAKVRTAVLATTGEDGMPDMRWVTPAILKGRPDAILMITSPNSNKVKQIKSNPCVQWMFQTRPLDQIIMVEGKVNIIDNPSIRSEVLEVVGPRLTAFWKINVDETDLLVLETVIEKATYYLSMKGKKEKVLFAREKKNG